MQKRFVITISLVFLFVISGLSQTKKQNENSLKLIIEPLTISEKGNNANLANVIFENTSKVIKKLHDSFF